jgi:hypothetical protein
MMRIRIYFNLSEVLIYSKNISVSFQEILDIIDLDRDDYNKISKRKIEEISRYLHKINMIIKCFDEECEKINHFLRDDKFIKFDDLEIIFKINEKLFNIVIEKIEKLIDLKVSKIYLN